MKRGEEHVSTQKPGERFRLGRKIIAARRRMVAESIKPIDRRGVPEVLDMPDLMEITG